MDFQAWSGGLALRPRDYLGTGEPLAAVVRSRGPLTGERLHLFALGSAATLARLHLGGIAGLRLSPANVLISPQGQALIAPGPRDCLFPAHDVGDWADVVVFAATGTMPDEGADLDRLLPALRAVIDECRRPDLGARPTAVDLVRILLGRTGPGRGGSVHELLMEAERRTAPPQQDAPEPPPPPPPPLWRRHPYAAGLTIGVLAVAVAAGAVAALSRDDAQPSMRAQSSPYAITPQDGHEGTEAPDG
ncbi:hypothetical protein [Nonomuraea sp. NPDC049309]|uniref:hypothetical protein n=1 Tax=Nonomuraea sp. NPDC049309 TaxID=3364350 RepID=UPI003722BF27